MPSPCKCIEHVVVLMMENRSFDHMLGYLPRQGHLKYLEGLTGEEFNHVEPGNPPSGKIPVSNQATFELLSKVRGVGPPHDFKSVNIQLSGADNGPSDTQPATNNGFVRAWIDSLKGFTRDENVYGNVWPEDWGRVMECFDPKNLPVLTRLAQEFVLCDHWFCSVPGPTMPNRLYVQAATSCGYAHNDFGKHFDCRTIYESLAESGYTWAAYHQNCDIVMNFTRLNYCKEKTNDPNFRDYKKFEQDIAEGNLAHYSFINPRFIENWGHLTDDFEAVSSQHAPCDIRPGENLIAEVYNALRRNEDVWKKTLLVILYDEHGGFYDHVPPPMNVPNPDGLNSPPEAAKSLPPEKLKEIPRFDFTRLGPRTPAILISPWLPRKLDSTVYEHSSLLATVKKLFNLKDFLTERDSHANSFEHLFDNAQFRDDTPPPFREDEIPKMPVIFPRLEDLPLDEVQIEIMEAIIPHLPKEKAEQAQALLGPPCKMTRRQGAEFQESAIDQFTECIIKNCGRHPHA